MKYLLIAAASAAMLAAMPAANSQTKGMELGVLDCKVEGGAGFIIGSTKDVLCTYRPANKDLAPENYHGTISKIGLDVGVTGETLITWAVLAPNADLYAPGALSGESFRRQRRGFRRDRRRRERADRRFEPHLFAAAA